MQQCKVRARKALSIQQIQQQRGRKHTPLICSYHVSLQGACQLAKFNSELSSSGVPTFTCSLGAPDDTSSHL